MKNLFLLMVMTTLFIACKKLYSDDELSIERENYNGDALRLDGYYFYDWGGERISIYFFYENGVLIDGNVIPKNELLEREERFMNGEFYDFAKDSKLNWGVFIIEEDNIKFEKWYSGNGSSKPTYISEGKILNDTTFLIFKSYRMKNGKQKEVSPENETYHFKAFSPKPDSTNQFIE